MFIAGKRKILFASQTSFLIRVAGKTTTIV
jgi:hypothetical protein